MYELCNGAPYAQPHDVVSCTVSPDFSLSIYLFTIPTMVTVVHGNSQYEIGIDSEGNLSHKNCSSFSENILYDYNLSFMCLGLHIIQDGQKTPDAIFFF